MRINLLGIAIIALVSITSGCASEPQVEKDVQPIRITAIGYGAENEYSNYSPARRKIMAIRAAKVDAYRALAEQIHGVYISGHSRSAAGASEIDSARTYIDAFVRGARILEITPQADSVYEVTLEATFDSTFFECLNGVRRLGCPRSPVVSHQPAMVVSP